MERNLKNLSRLVDLRSAELYLASYISNVGSTLVAATGKKNNPQYLAALDRRKRVQRELDATLEARAQVREVCVKAFEDIFGETEWRYNPSIRF